MTQNYFSLAFFSSKVSDCSSLALQHISLASSTKVGNSEPSHSELLAIKYIISKDSYIIHSAVLEISIKVNQDITRAKVILTVLTYPSIKQHTLKF